jgi:DNA-binding protein HU-beta
MNKTELVQAIAENANLTKVQAKAALDATLGAVEGALKKGDKVALIGFGTFQVVKKDARQGINPMTKAKIKIPAKKVVKFKAGAELAKKVNAKKK